MGQSACELTDGCKSLGVAQGLRLQRAHDDLLRSAASQKDFLDRQIEAYDNWSNRDAAFRALDRAGDSLSQAMNHYADAAAALGINP